MKRILKVVGILVVLMVVVAVALPFVIDANQFRPALETKLTAALGREVKLGDLKLSIFNGSVAASVLSMADDPAFSKTPFLRAKSLQVDVDLVPLILSRKLNVTGVLIDQPEVDLWQTSAGTWNVSSLGAETAQPPAPAPGSGAPAPGAAPGMDLTVTLIKITGGRFSLGQAGGAGKPEVLDNVNLELRDFSTSGAFPFSLDASFAGGGSIKLSGKAGPLAEADVAATPFDATLAISHLDLLASGFVNPATGLGGLASVDGTASSNGRTVSIKGKLTAENLKLTKGGSPAKPKVEVDLSLLHDMKKRAGTLDQGVIHIGKATASLTGSYTQGEVTAIHMKLNAPKMPVDDLAAMLPALNIALPDGASLQGGTATAEMAADGALDRLTSAGSLSIDNTTVKGFDLGTKLKGLERLIGTQAGQNTAVQTLSLLVHSAPDGTSIEQLNLVVPSIGTLTGAGTVSPAQELNFHLLVAAHTSGGVLAAMGAKGDTRVPLTVTGTPSNPVFAPDVNAVASEKLKQITTNPGGAVDAAKGILNMFKKKP